MMTRLIILGCGNSMGVPRIDGFWGKCNKNNTKNIRTRCSAIILKGSNSILIDTSPDIKSQFVKNNLKKGGKLYFAVKNKYSPSNFATSLLPWHSNRNLYSHDAYLKLLGDAGFDEITTYVVFPDYTYPMSMAPLTSAKTFSCNPVYPKCNSKKLTKRVINKLKSKYEELVFNKLKAFTLCTSFIFIATVDAC